MLTIHPLSRNFLVVIAVSAALGSAANTARAATTPTSWDVASEFDDQTNPGPTVWSYGEEPTLNGAFTLLPTVYNPAAGNVLGWTNATGFPLLGHNVNPFPYVVGSSFPVTLAPHGLQMHPGPGPTCAYAVARFTAPYSGKYKISGQFFGLDDNLTQTTTDVEISINSNPPVFTGTIDLNTPAHFASFTTINATLAVGNTVDFQVGCGPSGDYNFDSTGLNAVIELLKKKKR